MQAVERRKQVNIRVWRSLVSRLNGVQEAAGSNPVTRTKNTVKSYGFTVFLLLFYRLLNIAVGVSWYEWLIITNAITNTFSTGL